MNAAFVLYIYILYIFFYYLHIYDMMLIRSIWSICVNILSIYYMYIWMHISCVFKMKAMRWPILLLVSRLICLLYFKLFWSSHVPASQLQIHGMGNNYSCFSFPNASLGFFSTKPTGPCGGFHSTRFEVWSTCLVWSTVGWVEGLWRKKESFSAFFGVKFIDATSDDQKKKNKR